MSNKTKQTKTQNPTESKNCKRCKHTLPLSSFRISIRKHKLVSGDIKIYNYYVTYCKKCETAIIMSYPRTYNSIKQAAAFKRWRDKKIEQGINPNKRPFKKEN